MSLQLNKSSWERVRFSEFASNLTEKADPKQGDSATYIGLEHLDSGSLAVTRWGTEIDLVGTKLVASEGDILFARRNPYLRRVAVAPFDCLFSAHGMVLRSRPEVADHAFLAVFMASDPFMDRANQIAVGSLSRTINWSDLAAQEFALPPLEEQRRIAALYWAIEARSASLRAVAQNLEAVGDALLGTMRLGTKQVNDVLSMARAGATPSRSRKDFYGGGIPWLKSGEVSGDGIRSTEETLSELGLAKSSAVLIPEGATCVAMYGDGKTRGTVGRLAAPMTTNQAVLALVADPSQCHPEFLYLWMRSRTEHLRGKSGGAAQKNLNKGLVVSEPFPDATVEQQQALVERWDHLREVRGIVGHEQGSLESLKASLLALLEV